MWNFHLQVIWLKKDKPIKESIDVQLLFEGDRCSLSMRQSALSDAGLYKVLARNLYGVAESSCKLLVEREYCLSKFYL